MQTILIPGTNVPNWAAAVPNGESVVLDGLPNALYHGTKALISKSALDLFDRSPAHFHYAVHNPLPPEEPGDREEHFIIGSAFHSYVLEPDVFAREFVVLPDFGDMRSSRNRAMRDKWLDDKHPGKDPLTARQMAVVNGMRDGLYRNMRIRRALENGSPEVTCAVRCPHTGLLRKCRWDWLSEAEGIAIDLKSARDGRPDIWRREAATRRYNVQDTYYTETGKLCDIDIDGMGFAVVEKEPPYASGLYTLDATARLAGEMHYMRELEGIAERCQTNRWESYGDDAMELELPPYATSIVKNMP